MLDYDLAEIYGYKVKRLNKQGNKHSTSDGEILKSQFATSSLGGKKVYNKRQDEII